MPFAAGQVASDSRRHPVDPVPDAASIRSSASTDFRRSHCPAADSSERCATVSMMDPRMPCRCLHKADEDDVSHPVLPRHHRCRWSPASDIEYQDTVQVPSARLTLSLVGSARRFRLPSQSALRWLRARPRARISVLRHKRCADGRPRLPPDETARSVVSAEIRPAFRGRAR